MTEESSINTSHLFVAMTTEHVYESQTTGGTVVTSSSSRGIAFYFQCTAIIIIIPPSFEHNTC